MGKINYVNGDATQPIGEGEKVICHVANDLGAWGSGFVIAISKRWKAPEQQYYKFIKSLPKNERLGKVQFVVVESDIVVANMIGQHGTGRDENGLPPVRYAAIREALKDINTYCHLNNATVHAPRFGAGLSGGSWEIIEQIIKDEITVDVTIYDYVGNTYGAPTFKR